MHLRMRGIACVVSVFVVACSSSGDGGSGMQMATDAPASTGDASDQPLIDAPVATGKDPATDGDYPVSMMTASIPGAGQGRTVSATVYVPTGAPTPRPL